MAIFGLLIISHGSRSPEWVRQVDEAAAGVRLPDDIPVVSCFLEIVDGRLISDGIRELEDKGVTDIIAVPLFVSAGSTHVDEIAYSLGVVPSPSTETELKPLPMKARIHWTGPVDDDPIVAQIIYDKIEPMSQVPSEEILFLIGHGSGEPGFYEKWRGTLERLAGRVRLLGGFAGAETATLLPDELGTRLAEITRHYPGKAVLAAPLFMGEGFFTQTVIPSRMKGWVCRYNGEGMLPHPLVSRWIEEKAGYFLN
ncbi:sirohydrochlorin chelatase [Gorillibacterium massiliense]|uniref:sirohydrochlorin chelatase n=1 Tax=Gorillibacterium massiliense TaxID=1280390 RepID=UPI0004AF3DDC|nr:CbiX/SirB N-terminal domain-containing protein [Gorillibacterium massiliense]